MSVAPATIVVVDGGVIAVGLNDWPDGSSAAVLRECCTQAIGLKMVMSERLVDLIHSLGENGTISPDRGWAIEPFLGLLQGRTVWNRDATAESESPLPDYLNSLAGNHGAAAIVSYDDAVKARATAAPCLTPEEAVERWRL